MRHHGGPPYIRFWSCRTCGISGEVTPPPACPECGADGEDWYEEFDNAQR